MPDFISNDESLVGAYYLAGHDKYTQVITGEVEARVAGVVFRLDKVNFRIQEPTILKLHSPPFAQDVRVQSKANVDEENDQNLWILREQLLVFATDRRENLYLTHYDPEYVRRDWKEVCRLRDERFDALKLAELTRLGGPSSERGRELLRALASYEDQISRQLEANRQSRRNAAAQQVEYLNRAGLQQKNVPANVFGQDANSFLEAARQRQADKAKGSRFQPGQKLHNHYPKDSL